MRLKVNESRRAHCFPKIALAALLTFSMSACELDGASKKKAVAASDTPAGAKPPRTNLPMPPIETAHETNAATPRGAWTLPDGRRASLEDFRGQVVILDFWATYCPPCREEIPHLVRLQQQFGPQGFKVIGLNVGGAEDRPKVPDFAEQYGIQYQLAEPDDETVRLFLADDRNIPQTFVLNRQGKIVLHIVGYDGDAAIELDRAVSNALSEKAD
ncbi:MAG TPA: TlpA family protein disulfide reductase [Pyrinomonadaceae bacterium]|nr:TlpA family protein disulfide reductase [Pyrinomonadaceae bacterium]